MIAVDTNVALRLVLGDDAAQLDAILEAMAQDVLFISLTVLLETGWVLQSRYRMSRDDTAKALSGLLALDRVAVARPALAGWAIGRYRGGADLADVIHLVAAAKHDRFLTFDRGMKAKAGRDSPIAIDVLG